LKVQGKRKITTEGAEDTEKEGGEKEGQKQGQEKNRTLINQRVRHQLLDVLKLRSPGLEERIRYGSVVGGTAAVGRRTPD
jgi:hypothetical protein